MRDKDEIRSLNTKINSLNFKIKQLNDFNEENKAIKEGLACIRKDIENVDKEKKTIQNNISPVFNTFKKLISVNHDKYTKISGSYNQDLLSRMEKDNKFFEGNISNILKKTDQLIDNLYQRVNQYIASNKSEGDSPFDINTIKYNLFNVSKEINQIFEEIKKILELSNQYIADEEEETLRNINMIEIIINEIDRIMEFVPLNQSVRNNILGQLGLNALNYPLNTPTIKIILTSMQEVKRKRQTQLKAILNQIKEKSSKILEKQEEIKKEILSAINIIKNGGTNINKNNKPIVSIEDLFTTAKENGQNNIKDFENEVCGTLEKEINAFKQKIEDDRKKAEDSLQKAKQEFLKQWAKIKTDCCSNILEHAKNGLHSFFLPKLSNYQRYNEIAQVLKETIYAPEYKVVNFGLLNCTDAIKKIKEDVIPTKCIIPIGNKNDYLEKLNECLVKETNFIYYNNDEIFSEIYYDVVSALKRITYINNINILFPVIVVHYNDFSEFEKDGFYIEKFIINCLKIKAAFLFFFGKIESKEMKSTNKKIKAWIDERNSIKEALKESKYELSSELGYNLDKIKDGVELEMEKLTNFKKDSKNKINNDLKRELKTEYFDKMWNVYNTHSVVTDLESIQNAADEELCRHRCASSIMDFSILCLNLDKKPKERQLKDKEYEKIFQGITKIFDDIYSENLSKDFEQFMKNILDKKIFELYLNRERLMGEIDLQYNTCILTEEPDGNKIQKQIGEEVSILIEKNYKKDALKLVGRLIWPTVFERYRPKFYILMEDGFEIPENFEEYLIESFNKK